MILLFKSPNHQSIYTLQPTEEADFSVAFFDFHQQKKVEFSGKKTLATEEDFIKIDALFQQQHFQLEQNNEADSLLSYQMKIPIIQDFLEKENIPKLVYSRRKYHFFQEPISIIESFQKMCKNYPQAFVYLFVSDKECWLGGFYEVLGSYHKDSQLFTTMSLAGTLPLDENWSEKEITEQNAVTQYVESVIAKYSQDYSLFPTRDVFSGNIKHLCTEFSAKIDEKKARSIIEELHPTPAVCGTPKQLCKAKIAELETEERMLYSGYIELESKEKILCFVNLRCAKIYANGAKVFVGGGINEQSHPEKEWLETELKAQAILNNLVFLS